MTKTTSTAKLYNSTKPKTMNVTVETAGKAQAAATRPCSEANLQIEPRVTSHNAERSKSSTHCLNTLSRWPNWTSLSKSNQEKCTKTYQRRQSCRQSGASRAAYRPKRLALHPKKTLLTSLAQSLKVDPEHKTRWRQPASRRGSWMSTENWQRAWRPRSPP